MRWAMLLLVAALACAQPIPGTNTKPVFTTAGVTHAPEQGAIFEVKGPSAAALTARSGGYNPMAIFVSKDGYSLQQLTIMSTDFSTDLADGLNVYAGSDGSMNFDIGHGTVSTHPLSMLFDPVGGTWDVSVGNSEWLVSTTGSTFTLNSGTASTMSETHNFGGTGASSHNIFEVKAFPDPDGSGGHITSQIEIFMTSVADSSSNQTGAGINFATQSVSGNPSEAGYRLGVNAVYSTAGTIFVNNGFTLFDYTNSENIWTASTTRPHMLIIVKYLNQAPVHTSALDACSSVGAGTRAVVDDSDTNTWGATVVHTSGALTVGAFCDGTNWTVYAK